MKTVTAPVKNKNILKGDMRIIFKVKYGIIKKYKTNISPDIFSPCKMSAVNAATSQNTALENRIIPNVFAHATKNDDKIRKYRALAVPAGVISDQNENLSIPIKRGDPYRPTTASIYITKDTPTNKNTSKARLSRYRILTISNFNFLDKFANKKHNDKNTDINEDVIAEAPVNSPLYLTSNM